MAHMIPEYMEGTWYVVDGNRGIEYIPADLVADGYDVAEWHKSRDDHYPAKIPDKLAQYCESDQASDIQLVERVGVRLSAPGYLDCTDWLLFRNREEAETHVLEVDEVCPHCGESLEDEVYCAICANDGV